MHACPYCEGTGIAAKTPPFIAQFNGVVLTRREGAMLGWFVQNEGKIITKAQFMSVIYGDSPDAAQDKIIDIFIMRLRRKIEGSGAKIETIWGRGWVFWRPECAAAGRVGGV